MTTSTPSASRGTSFRGPRPLALRLWHWLSAAAVLGSLGTVLLRKTFLSWRANAQLIEAKVHELGGTISTDGAVAIAKALRAPMWDWHYVFGFAIAGLLVVRFGLGFFLEEQAPFRSAWREVTRWLPLPTAEKKDAAHHLLVRLSYAAFYVALSFMVLSGVALYFQSGLGLSKGVQGALKEAHELLMWFFPLFIAGHVTGVVVAELRGDRGLVSDMINGGAPADGS